VSLPSARGAPRRPRAGRSARCRAALAAAALALLSGAAAAQPVVERVPDTALSRKPLLPIETISAFADSSLTFEKDSRPGRFSKDRVWQSTIGTEIGVAPNLSLSAGLTYMRVDRSFRLQAGDYASNGATGYVGASVSFLDVWTLQVSAGYGLAEVDQTHVVADLPVAGGYTSIARFAGATLSGTYYFGDLLVQPFSQIVYADTRYPALVEQAEFVHRGVLDTVARAGIGAEAAYPFVFDRVLVAPVLRGAFLYDLNLPTGYTDRTAFEVAGGLNVLSGSLTAGARISATLARDAYVSRGVRAFVSYRF